MSYKFLLFPALPFGRLLSSAKFFISWPILHILSWNLLIYCVVSGLFTIPDAVYGGMYSNTDGQWAAWNAEFILHYGHFLDPSPYNAFAGMGSMFLPNLPWVNPAALMLGLPLPILVKYALSYLIYLAELAVSTIILARAFRLPWLAASLAAQLHILVLFPPFSHLFKPLEWYSAAPMYAQLSSILNIILALYLYLGRKSVRFSFTAGIFGIPALSAIGFLTAPFSFAFFLPPYMTLALIVIIFMRPGRQELGWKAASLVAIVVTLLMLGLPDYLHAMMENSARSPTSPVLWSALLSPSAWWNALRHHSVCGDARALICAKNPLNWLQLLALAGSVGLLFQSAVVLRALGAWGIFYTAGVHLYAIAYQLGWLGPIGTLSTHFLSWAGYSILVLAAVATIPTSFSLALRSVRAIDVLLCSNVDQCTREKIMAWTIYLLTAFKNGIDRIWPRAAALLELAVFSMLMIWLLTKLAKGTLLSIARDFTVPSGLTTSELRIWWWFVVVTFVFATTVAALRQVDSFSKLFIFKFPAILARTNFPKFAIFTGSLCALFAAPITAYSLLPALQSDRLPPKEQVTDPIVDTLVREARLDLGAPFRGYVATIWSSALDHYDPSIFRYIGARQYFERAYRTTFTETDLWTKGIPTFEEYGQWVSVQSQKLALNLLADEKTRQASQYPRFLRIFSPNIDIMRVLGIRYLITDYSFDYDPRLVLRVRESRSDAVPVNLYELRAPNLGNFSPTRPNLTNQDGGEILSLMRKDPASLDDEVYVLEPLDGPFEKATRASMTLIRDGYRITAQSPGRSLLLLPIQFSRCLIVAAKGKVRLMRANFLQTLVFFEKSLDATIQFRFGPLVGSACRYQDATDVSTLSKSVAP